MKQRCWRACAVLCLAVLAASACKDKPTKRWKIDSCDSAGDAFAAVFDEFRRKAGAVFKNPNAMGIIKAAVAAECETAKWDATVFDCIGRAHSLADLQRPECNISGESLQRLTVALQAAK